MLNSNATSRLGGAAMPMNL